MPLKVVPGKLDIQPDGIRFRLGDGATIVSCFVAKFVLQDLASHHLPGTNATDLQAFSELLPEIEHLANAKYGASRIEANGEIKLGTADLLRHGVHCPGAHLERTHMAIKDSGGKDSRVEHMNSQLPRSGRAGPDTPKARSLESLTALDKNRSRRKPDAALFRDGLHLRTPLHAGSKLSGSIQNPIDLFEPVSGTVVELNGALSQMRRPGQSVIDRTVEPRNFGRPE
jgi:hypothetical protein